MNADDAPLHTSWRRGLGRGVGAIVLAVGLYLLSYGPAIYLLMGRSKTIDRQVDSFYWPINRFASRIVPGFPLLYYRTWWYLLPGGPNDRLWRQSTP